MKTKRPHIAGLSLVCLFMSLLVASAEAGAAVSKGGRSADSLRTARGGVIAFDRRAHLAVGRPGGRGPHRIFLVYADGSALRQLTSRGNAIQPAWSPNGREIAFSNGSPRGDILIMSANGTKARVVVQGYATGPAFSPNGKRIAFARPRTSTIWSVRTDGSHALKLLSNADNPAWSPDGKQIAFVAPGTNGQDIYVASLTGGGRTQLTQDGGAVSPAWSPDGKQIAYIDSGEAGWGLRVLTVSDGSTRLLASNVAVNAKLTWSPDGKRIAFAQYGPTHERLMTVNATGGNLRTVTRKIGDSYGVSWRR
jgi:Tol biopolymer transport system component